MNLFGKPKPLIDPAAQVRIVEAIRTAEKGTTGEIRIFVESRCSWMDATDRAAELFHGLKMTETEKRNAVLIYLAIKDRQFSLYGDEGIFRHSGPEFWASSAEILQRRMRNGEFTEGLEECVHSLGQALAAAFPADPSVNRNELPDEIVFGK
jgi:uncharacterized membrane protein